MQSEDRDENENENEDENEDENEKTEVDPDESAKEKKEKWENWKCAQRFSSRFPPVCYATPDNPEQRRERTH